MNFTIVGAGAIGGTVGAHLARAGHDVTMVDVDDAHVRAMNESGLRITGSKNFAQPVQAVHPGELEGPLDQVILAVKAHHTRAAVEAVAGHLSASGYVVSMQNGFNEEVIADAVGQDRTIGAFVNFYADYIEPGVIMYGREGAMVLGELDGRQTSRLKELHQVIQSSFIATAKTTDNIWGYLWGKMGYGAQLFATALADETIGDIFALQEFRPVFVDLAAEVIRVADAEGVTSLGFDGYDPDLYRFGKRDWDAIHQSFGDMVAFNRASQKKKTGVWRDLAVRQRQTEVDNQLVPVSQHARKHDLATPILDKVTGLIKQLENGAPMTMHNLCVLREVRDAHYAS